MDSAEPIVVRPPVTGRWRAQNSPADKIPSHGVDAYGQRYAIDLSHVPEGSDQAARRWPPARRPEAFPSYGRPVHAPAAGLVVHAGDDQRDHWTRDTLLAMPYFAFEGILRVARGPDRLCGNHIILEIDDGVYALLAHLRHGSVRVAPGERVAAGGQLAQCGNSGNTTEPHLHFQLMDRPDLRSARGIPFIFDHYEGDAGAQRAVPRNGEYFTVPPPRS